MAPSTTEHPFTTGKDVSSVSFWDQSFTVRDETFAWLRANAPVSWHPALEDPNLPQSVHGENGFWAVTKAQDIRFVSQQHEVFSSQAGGVTMRPRNPGFSEAPTFLEMDPPDHTRYRQIMSSAFTPKAVARLGTKIDARAQQIVEAVVDAGEFDFVEHVSSRLPMLTVADMLGVPDDQSEQFASAGANVLAAFGGEGAPEGVDLLAYVGEQMGILRAIGVELISRRRAHPEEDIATAMASAEVDGRPLDDDQISSIMLLLSAAGNDTTKQTTSWTVVSLDRNPDQRAWLVEDFDARIGNAVEEFIRHASPVMDFARTATRDAALGGQQISAGDKLTMFYCSANRDDDEFPDAHRFDLSRRPNRHVGFGGGGVHYCLGNGVAKAQLRALFRQLLFQLPELRVIGEPVQLRSEFINGVTHLPVSSS